MRLEEHARRHVALPGIHRLPEDPEFNSPPAQIRGKREAVCSGPDDSDLNSCAHRMFLDTFADTRVAKPDGNTGRSAPEVLFGSEGVWTGNYDAGQPSG